MAQKKSVVLVKRRFWTPLRIVTTFVSLAMLVSLGVSSCSSNDQPSTSTGTAPSRPTAAGVTLPPNVLNAELKTVNGHSIRLADYSGKVLVVNLWATWCGPCQMEIPELVKLYNEFKSQGFEIVGLSTENPDTSAEAVREFVSSFQMGYTVGWATRDVAISLMRGDGAIPQSFLVTRDGRIVKRFVGFSRDTTPKQLRQAIEAALKG
ncbi:MAG TPA: TlpA disulfide reductase family protein [Pyrinomonadaceae bacterium]|nr:TlpA disulfide reductase family protein [Pyrinomonadaceae bacterium]